MIRSLIPFIVWYSFTGCVIMYVSWPAFMLTFQQHMEQTGPRYKNLKFIVAFIVSVIVWPRTAHSLNMAIEGATDYAKNNSS